MSKNLERVATVVSIVPFKLDEFKPGIYPGQFVIPGAKDGVPEILEVGESIYFVEIDEDRTITVRCPADDVAKAIVNDYVISSLAYSTDKDAAPGIFWVPGRYDLTGILTNFSHELEAAKGRQDRWFRELVQMADDDWEKSRQHKFISDIQRFAAKSLKLERPWIINPKIEVNVDRCFACFSVIQPEAVICPFCKAVLNMEKYKTIQFATK